MKTTLTPDDLKLREHLWSLSLVDALKMFDRLDGSGANNGAANIQAARNLVRVSLFYLVIKVLGWKEYAHPWSYARVIEVDQAPNGCIDLWARGHGKSSIITYAKTIQDLCVFDDVAFLVFSATADKAKTHTDVIKHILETNEILKTLFDDRFYAEPAKQSPHWAQSGFDIKRHRARKERSIKPAGFNRAFPTGYHSDVLVYDDTVTEESVETAEQIAKTKERYSQSKPLGSMESVERIIGTRYAHDDLYNDMIDSGSYQVREYPATDNGAVDGKPVMFTTAKWEKVREPPTTSKMIANQYLLNPMSAQDRVFLIENLVPYEVREQRMSAVILVDPAHSKKKYSVDTAIVVLGIGGSKRKYLLDGMCHKMNLGERYVNLRNLYWKWKHAMGITNIKVGYETYGSGNVDVEAIREFMRRDAMQWQPMNILELQDTQTGRTSKGDRILRLQPEIDRHLWFIPYETDPSRFTTQQNRALMSGSEELIAKPIRVLNKNTQEVYDLTAEFKKQLNHFPLGAKIDLIDAASRVNDMDLTDPHFGHVGAYVLSEEELT